MLEPTFKAIVIREIKSWYGIPHILTESEKKTSFQMMQQSLCTDLVYAILTTIVKHTSGIKKFEEHQWTHYKDYDFTNKHRFLLQYLPVSVAIKEKLGGEESKQKTSDETQSKFYIVDKEIWCTEYAPDIFQHLRLIDKFEM